MDWLEQMVIGLGVMVCPSKPGWSKQGVSKKFPNILLMSIYNLGTCHIALHVHTLIKKTPVSAVIFIDKPSLANESCPPEQLWTIRTELTRGSTLM